MSDVLDVIMKRRSIRKYSFEKVTDEEIKKLVTAGMCAPSARDLRPVRFIAVNERECLNKLAQASPYAGMLREATLCIAVLGDRESSGEYWRDDCAAATENILIEATALGLGSCWTAVTPNEQKIKAVSEVLGLPKNITPYCLIAIGHSDEEKQARDKFDAKNLRMNRW